MQIVFWLIGVGEVADDFISLGLDFIAGLFARLDKDGGFDIGHESFPYVEELGEVSMLYRSKAGSGDRCYRDMAWAERFVAFRSVFSA